MSIFTGQTSEHEPQSVDANGSEAYRFRSIPGERIAPIGPGIVEP
jgi:hypothetical protein